MQNARSNWLVCLGFAVGVIVVAAVMMPMFPKTGGAYPPGLGDPIFAFEMVQTAADLEAVFGPADDPERAARIAAMNQGNRWDYAFMLVYGGYICTFFLAVRRVTTHGLWLIPASLGVVAAVSDAIENMILLGLTSDLQNAPNIQVLGLFVWCKFICLMLCGIAAGLYLVTTGKTGWRIAGNLMIAGGLTVAAAFYSPESWGWTIGQGLGAVWVLQLTYVVAQSTGRDPQAAPANPS